MFSHALARKYGPQGIVSTSLNPGQLSLEISIIFIPDHPIQGGIRTELQRYTGSVADWILGVGTPALSRLKL